MWIKAGALGEPGSRSSNLALWTMAGMGITIGLYSSRKWVKYFNKKVDVLAREESDNGIDRSPDDIPCEKLGVLARKESDNGIDRLADDIPCEKLGVLGREESDNGIDRLPDDILCDIVSRLEIIEASRTSILSKRWRRIWTMKDSLMLTCVGTLDVSKWYHGYVDYDDRHRFLKAVGQCLHLYTGRKLKSFFVHCCFLNVYGFHLVRWMQTLARLDVEELCLGHSCQTCNGEPVDRAVAFYFKLIDGLHRLKYLDLASCCVITNFVRPCNSLVRLNLRGMPLFSHELSDILISCPNLTNVCLERCELPLNLRISGPNLKLETFELDACYHVQKLEISDTNIVKIMIDIRSEVEISLSSVPKLESLHLSTPRMHYSFEDAARDLPLLKYILIQTTYQILRLPSKFQVFGNVRILCLLTKGCPYGEACEEVDLWNFAPVLVAAPLLEEFYFTVGGPVCKRIRQPTEWPVLRHKHLTHMELSGFTFTGNVLEFVKYVFSSAQVLETLRLRPSFRRYNGGGGFYFEDVEALEQKEAVCKAVGAYLKGSNISRHATVELELI